MSREQPPPPVGRPAYRCPGGGAVGGLRYALGVLTVLPVAPVRWDRATARRGLVCAPVAGLTVGAGAAGVGALLWALGAGPPLAAVAVVATGAVLSRGLHLDGLADTADGLGGSRLAGPRSEEGQERRARSDAGLRIMRQPDIGPFGVVTLLLVLLAQVAALARVYATTGWLAGTLAVLTAALAGRTALPLACRRGVPSARPDGLGAAVADLVPVPTAVTVALGGTVLAGLLATPAGLLPGAVAPLAPWCVVLRCALAVPVALLAAELLLRHCRRRFQGVTGDVLGALTETASTAALVVWALGH